MVVVEVVVAVVKMIMVVLGISRTFGSRSINDNDSGGGGGGGELHPGMLTMVMK